jgi:hypothetical protein
VVKERWGGPAGSVLDAVTHPRWTRFGIAALATLVVATGFGLTAEILARHVPDPTLRLRTVSAAQVDQLGIKLAATRPPPYCALSDAVDDRGWSQSGLGGCPISRQVAEKDATVGGSVTVIESALGRATMPQNDSVGQNRLVWVVVVQGNRPRLVPVHSCPALSAGCFVGGPRLLLLDGQTGALLYESWAGMSGAGPVTPAQTVPLPARSGAAASG